MKETLIRRSEGAHKTLCCPSDLRIATRCRESEFPSTELVRLKADTRTCAAMAHVRVSIPNWSDRFIQKNVFMDSLAIEMD